MALTQHKTSTGVTIGTTEYSIINASTTVPGAETTDCSAYLLVDCGAIIAGDWFQVAMYKKTHASDSAVREIIANLIGIQPGNRYETPLFGMAMDWDFTLKKIAGTDRSIGYSLYIWTP